MSAEPRQIVRRHPRTVKRFQVSMCISSSLFFNTRIADLSDTHSLFPIVRVSVKAQMDVFTSVDCVQNIQNWHFNGR